MITAVGLLLGWSKNFADFGGWSEEGALQKPLPV